MARILLVEDDKSTRIIVRTSLTKAGHRVLEAASAEKALEAMQGRGPPDVAVLDVRLPGMDGIALAEQLRADSAQPGLPVIFLSAGVRAADIEQGKEAGAVYLTKPFVGPALLNAVDRLVPSDESW